MIAMSLVAILTFLVATQRIDFRSRANEVDKTNTILVKFKTPVDEHTVNTLNASEAVTQVDNIPALGIRVLRVPEGQDLDKVTERYSKNPLVEFAEVNALVTPEATPNDPGYGSAWHLPKISAPVAWDNAKATGVIITVCDTGVEGTHPDLQPILRADLGWNSVDGSTNWQPNGNHGTAVAGSVAAATNNSLGVAGVAWGATIIPVRISNLSNGSAYVSDAAKCVTYGVDHGSRIVNISYRMAGSSTLDTAGRYGQSKGALTFVAAGNDGINPGWVNYPGIIAVSATDQIDATTTWSNFGAFVDLSAPGSAIYSTTSNGAYTYVSGTSFSSPVAAGVAALIFGANPALNAAQAQDILFKNADDLGTSGYDVTYGWGRVNASRTVLSALSTNGIALPTATPTIALPTPTSGPVDTTPPIISISNPLNGAIMTRNSTVSISANASDNVGISKVEFYVNGTLTCADTTSSYACSWKVPGKPKANYTLSAKAYDLSGNTAVSVVNVTAK